MKRRENTERTNGKQDERKVSETKTKSQREKKTETINEYQKRNTNKNNSE